MLVSIFSAITCILVVGAFPENPPDFDIQEALLTIEETNQALKHFRNLIKGQRKTIWDLQSERDLTRRQAAVNSSVVGFTAFLNNTSALHNTQVIHFDTVVTNVGHSYHPHNGKFVCPVNGLYEFSCTIASNGEHKNVDARMMLDTKEIAMLHATLFGDDLGSQNAFVHCNQGQHVWVEHRSKHNQDLNAIYSTFSGHLIRRI